MISGTMVCSGSLGPGPFSSAEALSPTRSSILSGRPEKGLSSVSQFRLACWRVPCACPTRMEDEARALKLSARDTTHRTATAARAAMATERVEGVGGCIVRPKRGCASPGEENALNQQSGGEKLRAGSRSKGQPRPKKRCQKGSPKTEGERVWVVAMMMSTVRRRDQNIQMRVGGTQQRGVVPRRIRGCICAFSTGRGIVTSLVLSAEGTRGGSRGLVPWKTVLPADELPSLPLQRRLLKLPSNAKTSCNTSNYLQNQPRLKHSDVSIWSSGALTALSAHHQCTFQ